MLTFGIMSHLYDFGRLTRLHYLNLRHFMYKIVACRTSVNMRMEAIMFSLVIKNLTIPFACVCCSKHLRKRNDIFSDEAIHLRTDINFEKKEVDKFTLKGHGWVEDKKRPFS